MRDREYAHRPNRYEPYWEFETRTEQSRRERYTRKFAEWEEWKRSRDEDEALYLAYRNRLNRDETFYGFATRFKQSREK